MRNLIASIILTIGLIACSSPAPKEEAVSGPENIFGIYLIAEISQPESYSIVARLSTKGQAERLLETYRNLGRGPLVILQIHYEDFAIWYYPKDDTAAVVSKK